LSQVTGAWDGACPDPSLPPLPLLPMGVLHLWHGCGTFLRGPVRQHLGLSVGQVSPGKFRLYERLAVSSRMLPRDGAVFD
jgi:hypothetical protein